MRTLAIVTVLALAGCTVEVPLERRSCDAEHPCVNGWLCVEGLCVDTTTLRACSSDLGCSVGDVCRQGYCLRPLSDAGPPRDGGDGDAGSPDGGALDAGDDDAGPPDAGALDAGDDAGPPLADGGADAGPEEPLAPLVYWPFAFAEVVSRMPTLHVEARDGSAAIGFERSTSPAFDDDAGVTWVDTDLDDHAQVTLPQLADGDVLWWRARPEGGGPPTDPHSLRVNTGIPEPRWRLTEESQLSQGSFESTVAQRVDDGEVVLDGDVTEGSYTGPPVALRDVGGGRWGVLGFRALVFATTANKVRVHVERSQDGVIFVPLTDEVLPGNSSGTTRPLVDLGPIDPLAAPWLRFVWRFEHQLGTASPELRDAIVLPWPAAPAGEGFVNGDFESSGGWRLFEVEHDDSIGASLSTMAAPFTGARHARLTNLTTHAGHGRAAMIWQVVTVPSDATSLRYAIRYTREAWGSRIRVHLGSTELESVSCSGCASDSGGWLERTWDVSELAGQTVRFAVELDDGNTVNSGFGDHDGTVDLDDVRFE